MSTAVLADLIPVSKSDSSTRSHPIVRDITLVIGFALFTALAAQVSIPLGFTPVPLTGQTFAVLVSGSVLGMRRGAASQLVYWVMALVGLPFLADGQGGWTTATGATMGYLIGFVIAAAVIGYQAERRADRNLVSSISSMAMGSVIIYAFGATVLAYKVGAPVAVSNPDVLDGRTAISMGITPFLVGDVIKMALAGVVAPSAWAIVHRLKK